VEWHTSSLLDLERIIPDIAAALGQRRKVALYGDLGAGKTAFVQAFCRWLGTEERPESPTFSLVNEYTYTDPNGRPAVVRHIDLYRIKNVEEALDLGIEDMLHDSEYCFIEWPQIIEALLPADTARLHIGVVSATKRHLILS
jgi:tRNA threonylcarbamoyladenosine biosynthesis protein TsaE